MPAPTNPKKRSLMPSTPLRRTLRAAGHHLSPVVQIGKEGITAPVLRQLDDALETHELVKVKLGAESPEGRFEAAERIAAEPGVHLAQVLGRTLLAYRRHPERPRFEPLSPAEAAAEEVAALGVLDRLPEAAGEVLDAPRLALLLAHLEDVLLDWFGTRVLLLDAFEAGGEHDGEGQVGVAGGVG